MSTKYIVSNELCVEAAGNNEFYEIFNNKTKRDYRITPGMFKVLNLFEKGSSQEEVIEAIAREVNTEYKQISDLISPFIDFLVRSKSIINETVLKNNENTFNAGDTYKNYIIQDLIACNNKTEVYKCYNIETKSSYILKTLVKKNTASALQEKKLALALNNEFEITFKASTNNELVIKPVEKITDNIHGLILEFFDGDTIPAFLMKVKPENIKLSIEKLVLQILDGFELIHANSIVHGDIHLNNILVNDDLQIKIIDFGLADELDTKKSIIKFGGNQFFCPPERLGQNFQHKFTAQSNIVSEVYQIGLITYFVCYGQLPVDGYTWQELRNSILTALPLFINDDNYEKIEWSDQFKECLSIALHKSPEKRFQSVTAMKIFLNAITM